MLIEVIKAIYIMKILKLLRNHKIRLKMILKLELKRIKQYQQLEIILKILVFQQVKEKNLINKK